MTSLASLAYNQRYLVADCRFQRYLVKGSARIFFQAFPTGLCNLRVVRARMNAP